MAATLSRLCFMANNAVQLELSSKSLRVIMLADDNGMALKLIRQRVDRELGFAIECG